jgi:photosynthetic reaction center H subunit
MSIPGMLVGNIDVTQIVLAAFVLFFVLLVFHLRAEDKREGYPMVDPATGALEDGFPPIPRPKTFRLMEGGLAYAPHEDTLRTFALERLHDDPGSPLTPTGDPLLDGVGPAAYGLRRTEPLIYREGHIQMAPLRLLGGWALGDGDPDPRGMTVLGVDGKAAGVVTDVWIDKSVKILRYLEVEVGVGPGAPAGRRILLPIYHTDIKRRAREVRVKAARAARFADAPGPAQPDVVTAREEDQINAFWAGARFYRDQMIQEPLA